ncbi:MAG: hypothetical protein MUF51_01275 [Vicinamibacteria bacterium]|jgi:hypothetical protein|nr:hypothetical protein [Vicinamibacteria bacterium]
MEEIAFLILQFLLEVLMQVVFEMLTESGLAALKAEFERHNRSLPVAMLGYFFLGAGIGGLSLLIWPSRLLKPGPIPGLSLILVPLAVGAAMQAWGRYRRAKGHDSTNLATLPGGAAFAFGTALVRFLWAS